DQRLSRLGDEGQSVRVRHVHGREAAAGEGDGGHIGDSVANEHLAAAEGQRQRAFRHHRGTAEVDGTQGPGDVHAVERRALAGELPVLPAAQVERLQNLAGREVDAGDTATTGDVGQAIKDLDVVGAAGHRDGLLQLGLCGVGDIDKVQAGQSRGHHGNVV